MSLLNKEVEDATRKKLSESLEGPVTVIHFTQQPSRLILPDHIQVQECMFCKEAKQLLQEVCALSDKLDLMLYDFAADKEEAERMEVDKIPATIIGRDTKTNVRFYGIPSGYEYASLVEAIVDASRGRTALGPETKQALKSLERNIHIQTFVTPTCPYCTVSVRLGHQFAVESERVRADMIEATEFPHLAQKYNVISVPKTVINESITVEGAGAEDVFLDHVLKAGSSARKT